MIGRFILRTSACPDMARSGRGTGIACLTLDNTTGALAMTDSPGPLGIAPAGPLDTGTLVVARSPEPGPIGLDAGAAPADASTLRAAVLAYARARIRRRVGDGQCFALADRALRQANARSAADYGTVTADGDYVWGASITLAEVQPGDIVQFREFKWKVTRANGAWAEETRPHHTAVVQAVAADGVISVLEQNAPEGSATRSITMHFKAGTVTVGGESVAVEVSGTAWFYRPVAR